MSEGASRLSRDADVADQADNGIGVDRPRAPPLAERDKAAGEEFQAIEERRDLVTIPKPDLDRGAFVVPRGRIQGLGQAGISVREMKIRWPGGTCARQGAGYVRRGAR
jgi:hypothetical protein